MLIFGTIIGIYSLIIFFLGITGFFNLIPLSLVFFVFSVFIYLRSFRLRMVRNLKLNKIEKFSLSLIVIMLMINLIGALSPELAFDALWYHLTIPKIFIDKEQIFFIPGGLFYYSLMPKLTEMLFLVGLMIGNEITAKLIHFTFGILSSFALFKLLRSYLSRENSILGVLIFLSSLVVSWLMTTAYVDLSRSFYEILALLYFLKYDKTNKKSYLIASSIMLGFAVSVKLVSLGSIAVFNLLIMARSRKFRSFINNSLTFSTLALTVPLPWFVYSFIHTGNPIYPLFSKLGPQNLIDLLNPFLFAKTFLNSLLYSADPINPIFVMAIPLVFFKSKGFFAKYKLLFIYAISNYIVWYFFFQAGGSRFLTSYFGGYILLLMLLVDSEQNKLKKLYIGLIFFIAAVSILYRGVATSRSLPYLIGIQTKEDFLMSRLNFNFGDFYDEGGKIKKIVGDDLVVLHNVHNIYYVDFNYTFPEWADSKNAKYALVYSDDLHEVEAKLVYQNKRTNVKLYEL